MHSEGPVARNRRNRANEQAHRGEQICGHGISIIAYSTHIRELEI